MNASQSFYRRQRQDEAINYFYENVVALAEKLSIGAPRLSRYRRQPQRFDEGTQPHVFTEPKAFFHQKYFEACDLLIQELTNRFKQREVVQTLIAMEHLLIKSANGEVFTEQLKHVHDSVYKDDLDFNKLQRHLAFLTDVVHEALPKVKKVTVIQTICEAMKAHANRNLLSEVHKLLRLYLTIPITSATSEKR